MKRALLVVLFAVSAIAGTACNNNPVGRICFIGVDAGNDQQNILASPALECQSRTCLHMAGNSGKPDLCTGECSSDSDCDKVAESPCHGGFVCAVPVVVGPFCCKKECICRDYLAGLPDGGSPMQPASCDSSNAVNECCNLDGRRGNPQYPLCK